MRAWSKRVLILSLVVGLAVVLYNRPRPDSVADTSGADTAIENDPAGIAADTLLDTQAEVTRWTSRSGSSGTVTSQNTLALPPAYILELDVPMGEWKLNYEKLVQNATPQDHDQKRQMADELDADAAYWLHVFYSRCDSAPRTEMQLDQALARTQRHAERVIDAGHDGRLDRVLQSLDWYEQSFQLCSFLDPEFDARLESLIWLGKAADLGHMGALRLYHSQARLLIVGNDSNLVFQHPDLILEFKSRARRYARRLLETDHPQGYILTARMYYVGDVYEQDYSMAYAYARVASLIGTAGSQTDAQSWMGLIAVQLTPSQLADAEIMAAEIQHR